MRRLRIAVAPHRVGDSKVDQLHGPALFDEDVARLDVAVDQALLVRMGGRLADAHEEFHPLPLGQVVFVGMRRDRSGVGNELHHEIRQPATGAVGDAGGVDLRDARMPEPREGGSLMLEP